MINACEAAPNASHSAAPLKHSHDDDRSWKPPAAVELLELSTLGQSAPSGRANADGRAAAELASSSHLLLLLLLLLPLASGAAVAGSCAPASVIATWCSHVARCFSWSMQA
jgi:hypothetical protein